MAPRRRCPTCGSRQWHKEPSSGLIACSEGHVLLNYRNETTEVEEMGPHAVKKRTLKSGRKKKGNKKGSGADPKLYHGARGRFHYFLCLQHIHRIQIQKLTILWKLPPEFELICRDIWIQHLSLLKNPVPAEPLVEINAEKSTATQDVKGEESDSDLEGLIESSSDESSSGSSDDEEDETPIEEKKRKGKGHAREETPMSTLGVLVLGCWTLRLPIMYKDISRVVERYEIPYLEGFKSLPKSMVEHLTKHEIQALSPGHTPDTMKLHWITSRMAGKLYLKYGVYTPEVNGGAVLWRLVQGMGGTPALYGMSKRLASKLSLGLVVNGGLAPKERQRVVGRRGENVPAEVALLATVMIVLKMVNKDGIAELKGDDNLFVGDMDPATLDEYIGFCSRILPEDSAGILERFFPLEHTEEAEGATRSSVGVSSTTLLSVMAEYERVMTSNGSFRFVNK